MTLGNVSAVLVRGAWADGSSWSKVIDRLKAHGINAIAAPLRLHVWARQSGGRFGETGRAGFWLPSRTG